MIRSLVLGLTLLVPPALPAQQVANGTMPVPRSGAARLRVWSTGVTEIAARDDGLVSITITTPLTATSQRLLAPALLLAWTDTTRKFLKRIDRGEAGPSALFIRNIDLYASSAPDIRSRVCDDNFILASGSRAVTALLSVLDSAAHLAASVRAKRLATASARPFEQSEIGCLARGGERRLALPVIRIPYVGPEIEGGAVEVLARAGVSAGGMIDTAAVRFFPTLSPALRRPAITRLIARAPALRITAGGVFVPQWIHASIRFEDGGPDPMHSAVSSESATEWIARSDGLVEWRGRTDYLFASTAREKRGSQRDLFKPREVLAWLDRVARLRDSAWRYTLRFHGPDPSPATDPDPLHIFHEPWATGTPVTTASSWYTILGNPLASRLIATAGLIRPHDSRIPLTGEPHLVLQSGWCGESSLHDERIDLAADSLLRAARTAAETALARRPNPVLDLTRPYAENQVDCPAERRGLPILRMQQDDSISAALALPRDIVAVFVVDAAGEVDLRSLQLWGEVDPAARARIAGALATLHYLPATMAGYRVAQYEHYVIRRGYHVVPAPVHRACVAQDGMGIDLTVLSPSTGAPRLALEQIADAIAGTLQRLRLPGLTETAAAFRFVLTPDGQPSFLRWTTPANDAIQPVPATFGPRPLLPPLGLQVSTGARCP